MYRLQFVFFCIHQGVTVVFYYMQCPTHLTSALLVRVSASVADQAPRRMSELHPTRLGGSSGSLDESRRSPSSEGLGVNQCVESFDGMQVPRDLGDALMLVTEWGGWE